VPLIQLMKKYLKFIPESYAIVSVMYYWLDTGRYFNPFALALLVALAVLLFFRNRTFGVLVSLLFILVNLFLFTALMSEYRHFHEPSPAAADILLYGSVYLALNLLMALVMLVKYALTDVSSKPVRL